MDDATDSYITEVDVSARTVYRVEDVCEIHLLVTIATGFFLPSRQELRRTGKTATAVIFFLSQYFAPDAVDCAALCVWCGVEPIGACRAMRIGFRMMRCILSADCLPSFEACFASVRPMCLGWDIPSASLVIRCFEFSFVLIYFAAIKKPNVTLDISILEYVWNNWFNVNLFMLTLIFSSR